MVQSSQKYEDGGIEGVSVSDQHRLLANERRRLLLEVLETRETATSLDSVAEDIATREGDESSTSRVALSLHHVHLPMLSQTGIIDYDPDAHEISQ